jgi:hypothetical protein
LINGFHYLFSFLSYKKLCHLKSLAPPFPLKLELWMNLDFSLGDAKGREVETLMCPMTHHQLLV